MTGKSSWWRVRTVWSTSPLVRLGDRIDGVALVLATVGVLLLLPVAATVGAVARADLEEHAQQARSTVVSAQAVLTTGPVSASTAPESAATAQTFAAARWIAPDGLERFDEVRVDTDDRVGDVIGIWMDQDGNIVDRPLTTFDTAVAGTAVALSIWATGSIIAVAFVSVVLHINAHRCRNQWERDWEALDRARGRNIEW